MGAGNEWSPAGRGWPGFAGSKTGTFLCLDVHVTARLRDNGILFTPTIDVEDDESTRNGPLEFKRRGYQRPPDPARVKKISLYYRKEDILKFTTPIIVAVRKGFSSSGLLALIDKAISGDESAIQALQNALAVIDGQHRLEGAIMAARVAREKGEAFELDLLFLLVHGLDYKEETTLFNIINTTPKRLPKALVEWNRYGITEDGSATRDQDIRQIAVMLATDKTSVWHDQVNLTGTGREPGRPVTLEGLRRSTDNMLKAGGLRHMKLDRQYELVKAYWAAVADTFSTAWNDEQPDVRQADGSYAQAGTEVDVDGELVKIPRAVDYRIKDLVGVASLAKLGGDILAEALGNPNPEEHIRAEVQKIDDVDWRKIDENPWTSGQAGFAGQKGLYEALSFLRANGIEPWNSPSFHASSSISDGTADYGESHEEDDD